MPKNISEDLENLLKIVTAHPTGISIEELHIQTGIPKRTLQYRLSQLSNAGNLITEGSGKSLKYYPKRGTSLIPYSDAALEIQKIISEPIQLRPHVSYRREFLETYEPNQSFYLSTPILEKLALLGDGMGPERPAGTYARKIYERLLIDLSWNSSRLEGNTYSILETEKLLETGEGAKGKDRMETQMILNHKEAIEFLVEMAEEIDIQRYTILNIHGLLSHDLLKDPKASGRLRTLPVKIGKSVYHPLEVPHLIEEYFQLIVQKAAAIKNPFEQSIFLMIHLPYLQPFLDVNKRVSRLAGNIPFIRDNLCPLSFVDVPEQDYIQGLLAVYELNRIELFRDVFVWAYERSASLYTVTAESLGQPDPFRIRYRNLIRQAILQLVQQKVARTVADQTIQNFSKSHIPLADQNRFVDIVVTEMRSLHEGNFARFRIRPSEFFEWREIW